MVNREQLEHEWHAAKNGDAPALDAVTQRLMPVVQQAIRHRLRRFGSPSDLVDDVAQEVLFKISQGVRRCRATSTPQIIAWIHVIARRAVLDLLRSPNAPLRFGAILLDDAHLEAEWTRVDDAPVVDPMIARLCELAVEEQRGLSAHTAQLLWHRLVEGTSPGDLGRQFGVPEGAIKRRVARAIAAVRRRVCIRVDLLPPAERERLLPLLQRWTA